MQGDSLSPHLPALELSTIPGGRDAWSYSSSLETTRRGTADRHRDRDRGQLGVEKWRKDLGLGRPVKPLS